MRLKLRDYQEVAIQDLRARFRAGDRAVMLQIPTGGGKTVVASFVIDGATKRGNNVWFLCHRKELVRQSVTTLNEIGIDCGVIATGFTPNPTAKVQVAMVQTLARRLGKYKAPDLIIQDEAHHLRASTFRSIIDYYPSAKILGLSATPARLDGQGLGIQSGGHFQSMVNGPSLSQLINQGSLCRPRIYAPPISANLDGLHKRYGEFVQSEVAAAMDKPVITGDAIEHYRKICHQTPAIVFCANVAHAEHVAEQFRTAGYTAASIDGTMADHERKGRITALGNGGLNILTSVDILGEGVDVPVVGAAILLRPTASLSLLLQQVGRALRLYPGKEFASIIDHVGNIHRHDLDGLGHEAYDIEWSLDGDIKRKKKPGESSAPYKQCIKCYSIHAPAPVCPMCGHVYETNARELEQVDGSLHEIDPATLERLQKIETDRGRWDRVREERSCKTYADFAALAASRGYSQSWAGIRWAQVKKRMAPALPGI